MCIKSLKCAIIYNYSAYDLIDNYSLYIEKYFKSNRKYHSLQDFCNPETLRIIYERSK